MRTRTQRLDPRLARRTFAAGILALLLALPAGAAKHPWWDDFPTIVQTDDPRQAARSHATGVLCGAADDQAWGIWGQRLRVSESGPRTTKALHAAGLQALTYVEGYGNPVCFVVQVKRNPDGSYIKEPGTDMTRAFLNAWGWDHFDGTGEVRWVGAHTYFDDADYARPYTRTHPRYGAPPMRYPDGRIATGYLGSAADPRNSRVFDASCGKNVLGQMWADTAGQTVITDALRGGAPSQAPKPGEPDNAPTVVPDPGYTPAEWAERTRKTGALTIFGADKDSVCPLWIDYARAEVRLALDTGVDGMWVDNFSPWDSFNASPIHHAFGEWSVALFRPYLKAHFSPAALRRMGVTDLARFDVRDYLQERVRAWGGDPRKLADARWADPRWQDDPVWRAYLIYRCQEGTKALSRLYKTYKTEAAKAGKPDFLVMGNDIPAFSLGWPRGDLDMVSTELTWGWWLATGPRGIMPPPLGSYVPVYKVAREHARSRFVNAWMYAADEAKGKPNIARVLYYQGLAAHALPMPQFSDKTVGTEQSNADYFAFVRRVAPTLGERLPVEQVGLYYSSSSLLVDMLPAGYRDHAHQVHSFSFWGWGTALTWLRAPWRAVPEWKLNPAMLHSLHLLIIPSAEVFPASDVPVLERWVRSGGRLLIAGNCGTRSGEADNFERCASGSTLARLLGPASTDGRARSLGKGTVLIVRDDPGYPFFQASTDRPPMLARFGALMAAAGAGAGRLALSAPGASWKEGLTLYCDGERLFVDANNTDIDLASDVVTPAPPVQFSVTLPSALRGRRLRARVLSPDANAPTATLSRLGKDRVAVRLGTVPLYACVVIEAAK